MLRRTEAVVLKTIPFSEADLIATLLTSDYGLLKAFVKSPRKTKSRFGSSLEPLTYSRISFWGREDANLPRLTQADIIRPFQAIRGDLDCFMRVAEIIELTLNLLPERDLNKGIFGLLLDILDEIEKDCLNSSMTQFKAILYKVKFFEMAGYGPGLNGCARCNKPGYNFYASHSSILCGDCSLNMDSYIMDSYIRLSPGVIRLYETLKKWEISKIGRIKPSAQLLSELTDFLDNHARHTTAKPLRTRFQNS